MLTVEDVRRRLNDPSLTDEQAAEVRDTLDALARLIVDDYIRTHTGRR